MRIFPTAHCVCVHVKLQLPWEEEEWWAGCLALAFSTLEEQHCTAKMCMQLWMVLLLGLNLPQAIKYPFYICISVDLFVVPWGFLMPSEILPLLKTKEHLNEGRNIISTWLIWFTDGLTDLCVDPGVQRCKFCFTKQPCCSGLFYPGVI